jgi:hypothetical protein
MSKDFTEIARDVVTGVGLLQRGAPDTMKAFGSLSTAATSDKCGKADEQSWSWRSCCFSLSQHRGTRHKVYVGTFMPAWGGAQLRFSMSNGRTSSLHSPIRIR